MKNSVIRLIFILALLSAIGIIITQVYWVRRAYILEDKDFNLKVNVGLRNAARHYWNLKDIQPSAYNIVDRMEPDYYIVQINDKIDSDILAHILRVEFEKINLITDFEFGLYDCMRDSVITRRYVQMSGSNEHVAPIMEFPKLSRENYYFGIHFPHRKEFLTQKLAIWYISSAFLLFILAFLGYIIVLILKQKRLSEVQKDFVNNMTHEFKTPLASIQLAAEVLKNPKISEKPQRLLSYATIIDNEAAKLALQIERVLQMAHAEKGIIQLQKEEITIQELIKTVAQDFENMLINKNVKLSLILPDEPIIIEGDRLHINNVISNLLDNALKYGSELPEIEIRVFKKKTTVEIQVADNGIGIDEAHQKLLFKKFYRVPTGNLHNVKGFGLGLNYAEIIAKTHGGTIKCFSKKGEGSIFTIIFPLKNDIHGKKSKNTTGRG